MIEIRCKNCNGNSFSRKDDLFICDSCGSIYLVRDEKEAENLWTITGGGEPPQRGWAGYIEEAARAVGSEQSPEAVKKAEIFRKWGKILLVLAVLGFVAAGISLFASAREAVPVFLGYGVLLLGASWFCERKGTQF